MPATQYDFRPDAGGRSLGELAWHLAEGDAYISYGVEMGQKLKPEDLDRSIQFFTGPMSVREILWSAIISHGIHHRGGRA